MNRRLNRTVKLKRAATLIQYQLSVWNRPLSLRRKTPTVSLGVGEAYTNNKHGG